MRIADKIHNFLYTNEPRIDDDFSQVMESLITGITTKRITELKLEGEGKLSLGPVLEWLGLNLGIGGRIERRKVQEEELKQELKVANKLAIVEGILRKEKSLAEVFLDSSSTDEQDEQKLINSLRSSKFCLLVGTFTISEEIRGERRYILFSKALESNIISIPASHQYIRSHRLVDFAATHRTPVCAFCYYLKSNSDSVKEPPFTHFFDPRAIWNF
jgi:hypothetical protein